MSSAEAPEPSIRLIERITPADRYDHGATAIVVHRETAYQDLCIADTPAFGRMVVLDGIVQSSAADEFIYHEALVQPAMMATGAPRRVLVLGGGEGATLREVLRWKSVERAVMVDIDGEMIALARTELAEWHCGSFDDPRTELIVGDAVEFLRTTTERFDVVISDMTDPVDDGPAMFCFTREYFAAITQVLTPEGVLAVQAGPQVPIDCTLHARVVRTIATAFDAVIPYPCNAPVYGRALGFVVASAVPIAARLAAAEAALSAAAVSGLRYCDAAMARALLAAVPPYLTDAIAASDTVFSEAAPPRTHGTAGWSDADAVAADHER